MTDSTTNPAATIVAGNVTHVRPTNEHGGFLRMHDGAIYIQMTAEVAAQWIPKLQEIINNEKSKA